MEIGFIFKIAAIGIIVALLSQILARYGREEQASLTALAGLIVVLSMILIQLSGLFSTIEEMLRF